MEVLKTVGEVCGVACAVYLGIAVQTAVMVIIQSRMDGSKVREDPAPNANVLARYNTWAVANGFELLGTYRALGVPIAAWVHTDEPTYFCVYGGRITDLVTILAGGNDVTTCSSRSGVLFPSRAGDWKQALPGRDLDQLWPLHGEAVDYVISRCRARLADEPTDFRESLAQSTRRQAEHVRTLPLWPLRWPYWFFIRRWRLANRTVREQVESGLVA